MFASAATILHSPAHSAWKSITFVVVTYTNVLVKELIYGAAFSVWETFSYTNPLAP